MRALAQTVLPFKLEVTDGMLTANAGLALSVEFIQGPRFSRWLAQQMPKPGSGRGYEAPAYVKPLMPMLTGGRRALEDLRTLKGDTALSSVLQQHYCPPRTRWAAGCAAPEQEMVWLAFPASTSGSSPQGFSKPATTCTSDKPELQIYI